MKITIEANVPDGPYCNFNTGYESGICAYYVVGQFRCNLFGVSIVADDNRLKCSRCLKACEEANENNKDA